MEFQDLIDAGFWPADLTEATLQRARDGLTKAARRQAGYPGYKDDLATLKRARDHFQVQLAAMSVIFPYAILAARDAEVPFSTALRRVKDLCEFRDPEGGLGLVAEPPFDGAPPVQPPPHPNVSEMVPREWFSWLLDVRRESEGRSAHAIDHRAAWEERAVALARALRVPGAQSPHKTTSYDSLVLATAAAMPIALLLHPRTGVWDLPAQGWSLLVLEALTSPRRWTAWRCRVGSPW